MKQGMRVVFPDTGVSFAFRESNGDACDHAALVFYSDHYGFDTSAQLNTMDVVSLGLLYRAIGDLIDSLQVGVVHDLPFGDPSEVDAMMIRHEISRKWDELNQED